MENTRNTPARTRRQDLCSFIFASLSAVRFSYVLSNFLPSMGAHIHKEVGTQNMTGSIFPTLISSISFERINSYEK
jgi:hypothetical protein